MRTSSFKKDLPRLFLLALLTGLILCPLITVFAKAVITDGRLDLYQAWRTIASAENVQTDLQVAVARRVHRAVLDRHRCADGLSSRAHGAQKAQLTHRNEVIIMMYKTIVIDYAPKAKKMAAAIEQTANEKAQDGWELVTFSVTNSAKAILVFRTPDAVPQEQTAEAVGDAE